MSETKLTFAQAMERLDVITKELNQNTISLEKAMDLFKEGLKLTKECQEQLQKFEHEMQQLIEEDAS